MDNTLYNIRLWCLILLLFIGGCSAGSPNQPNTNPGYIQFSESSVTVGVNQTITMTAYLMNAAVPVSNNNIPILVFESGIVAVNPDVCILNNQSPPSCTFNITGLSPGVTSIGIAWVIPGQPLSVTVPNP